MIPAAIAKTCRNHAKGVHSDATEHLLRLQPAAAQTTVCLTFSRAEPAASDLFGPVCVYHSAAVACRRLGHLVHAPRQGYHTVSV